MKSITLKILALLAIVATSTQAIAADELVDLIKCRPVILQPNMGMSLTLSAGGVAGITLVKIERFFLGRSTVQTFVVRQFADFQQNERQVVFLGEDISFEANFSVATNDGGVPGLLKLRQGTNDFSLEELSCAIIQPNPQVNYVY